MIDIDALQPSVGISAGHRLRCAPLTNGVPVPDATGALPRMQPGQGKHRAYVQECSLYMGLWICAVCCRMGSDLRAIMCPFSTGGIE